MVSYSAGKAARPDRPFAASLAASPESNAHMACDRVNVNGRPCVWWGSQCIISAQCTMKEGKCQGDCMSCGAYGCVPRGRQCPTGCEQFNEKGRCNQYMASNGINCHWDTGRGICTYAVGETPLGQLRTEPSAIGGSASPAPSPLDLLTMMRKNILANRPSRLPDGTSISSEQMTNLGFASLRTANTPIANSVASPGDSRLGADSLDDDDPTQVADGQRDPASSKTTDGSPSSTSTGNNGNGSNASNKSSTNNGGGGDNGGGGGNGPLDASLQQSSTSGSIKLWGALCGVAVAIVAVAGIAFLVVQQRMRARRELLAEQRNAEMHNVHPEHRRESLLPYVQHALETSDLAQPEPSTTTAGHAS
ncbi:hypothetical protein SYNPS1DRAFT_29926 [Syncephalis pseudoplumigaleata]|uniref:Uncharacterized protein n=1 Tax=Syncephalis pseudoplumigaleata TaxID=1712513 RepID=A0A4P9YZ53_9FUNG|nr:hypothetical protein SYNPS1DRAFT_29926 [Syncephalis pseudoplumigaleata]|eukprot:RKP24310.1 hypothetical protein SYNPS1DRAFT_29926 [Syncephalis pseudoplumigaleata]